MSLPWLSDPRRPMVSPRELPNLAAWFDALDTSSMLSATGAAITDGSAVALWADKSGNSGVNCLVLNAVSGNYASLPDADYLDLPATFCIEVDVALNDWTPSALNDLLGRYVGLGNKRSYLFRVQTNGILSFIMSTGGDAGTVTQHDSTVAPTVSDLSRLRIRFYKNGAVGQFYTSTDGATWSKLGNDVVTPAGAPFATDIGLNIGSTSGTADLVNGRMYAVRIYSDLGVTKLLDCDFSTSAKKLANGDTFVCSTGQTVTLNSSGATGARIAGERDLYQGTAPNRPVYLNFKGTKYGYLNGVAGNYFSTPDSAALDIIGPIEIQYFCALNDWSSATQWFVSKVQTDGQSSYDFGISATGVLSFRYTATGAFAGLVTANASAAVPFADFAYGGVKVTYNTVTGKVNFYTSTDSGANWTLLGTEQTITAGAIFAGTDILTIGAEVTGASGVNTGNIYRAQIYNGIAGTLVFDFNPATYTSGTTFADSSSNAATIALNGGATIVTRSGLYFDGSNDYLKTAAFSYAQPESVYFVGSQVSWTLNDTIFDGNAGTAAALYQSAVTPAIRTISLGGGAGTAVTTLSVATNAVVASVFSGASGLLRVNRLASVAQNTGTTDANGFTVGALGTGAQPANITASEIILRSAADATATQDRIALYAGRRWGIAV